MEGNLAWKGPPIELNIGAIFAFCVYYVKLRKHGREVGSERTPLELTIKDIFPFYVYHVNLKKYGREVGLERTPLSSL